jgi:hypothetical protein
MATPFDSFNRSTLDAFFQSPLLARGGNSVPVVADLSMSMSLSTTLTKLPMNLLFGYSQRIRRIYTYHTATHTFDFTSETLVNTGANGIPGVSGINGAAVNNRDYQIDRYFSTITIPNTIPANSTCDVAINIGPINGGVSVELYATLGTIADEAWGPLGSLVGTFPSTPTTTASLPFFNVSGGQKWLLQWIVPNDMSYLVDPFTGVDYTMGSDLSYPHLRIYGP